MPKIRVLIVEDSHVVREFLQFLIAQDPRLEVAAAVESAEDALQIIHDVSPDVISMDIRLPGMNGLEATQQIMRDRPTPIVVVSASVEADDLRISMNALRAGALAVVEKPVGLSHDNYAALADKLCTQLVLMSQVKVVRQRLGRTLGGKERSRVGSTAIPKIAPIRMVGIIASTGGPAALQAVLGTLPATFPVPIVLVQHIAGGFVEGFAAWLGSVVALRVTIPKDGETAKAGHIYVAPADRHLKVELSRLRLDTTAEVSSQRPSGTVLLRSLARSFGASALGVLLTGMGDDGALGLKEIRDAGGYTIAEAESTAVVYGMPKVAVQLGAVCESLPLPEIGPRVLQLASRLPEVG
jgi:two-component system chemotaxis response regulator CheB